MYQNTYNEDEPSTYPGFKRYKPGEGMKRGEISCYMIGYTRPKSFLMLDYIIKNNIPYITYDCEGALKKRNCNENHRS